jgi:xanthine dehydrogenase iron-sulfur cluster and FAD-binding subunit A
MRESISSKKLWFSVGCVLLAFVYTLLAASKFPEMKSLFDGFTGVLEFIAAAYLTGNIANKWVVGKVAPAAEPEPKPAKPKPPPGGPKVPDED